MSAGDQVKEQQGIQARFKLFYRGVEEKWSRTGPEGGVCKEELKRGMKIEAEGLMWNVVIGSAPQVGREEEEKEKI